MPGNKKVLKGALTVATGTALLVGGFGSFALWSEQDPLPNAPITAGELSLQTEAESWVDESPDAATTTWDPATDELVPGDTVTLTVPLAVTAVGKNLAGTIHLDPAAFDTTDFGPNFTVSYDVAPTPEPRDGRGGRKCLLPAQRHGRRRHRGRGDGHVRALLDGIPSMRPRTRTRCRPTCSS